MENHPSRPTNDSDRSIQLSLRLRDPEGDMKKEVEYMIMKAPGVSLTNLEEFTELTFAYRVQLTLKRQNTTFHLTHTMIQPQRTNSR